MAPNLAPVSLAVPASATWQTQLMALSSLSVHALISSCVPDLQLPPLPRIPLLTLLSRPTLSAISFSKPSQVPSFGLGIYLPLPLTPKHILCISMMTQTASIFQSVTYCLFATTHPTIKPRAHIILIFHPQHPPNCIICSRLSRLLAFNFSKCQKFMPSNVQLQLRSLSRIGRISSAELLKFKCA